MARGRNDYEHQLQFFDHGRLQFRGYFHRRIGTQHLCERFSRLGRWLRNTSEVKLEVNLRILSGRSLDSGVNLNTHNATLSKNIHCQYTTQLTLDKFLQVKDRDKLPSDDNEQQTLPVPTIDSGGEFTEAVKEDKKITPPRLPIPSPKKNYTHPRLSINGAIILTAQDVVHAVWRLTRIMSAVNSAGTGHVIFQTDINEPNG